MKKEAMKLYDSELNVMEVLWEKGELRAGEIVKILSDRIGWNRNTTYTIIKKCVEKGAIKRIEPKFICSPMVDKEDVQRYEIRELVNRMFDGDWEKMMAMAEEIHSIEERKETYADFCRCGCMSCRFCC